MKPPSLPALKNIERAMVLFQFIEKNGDLTAMTITTGKRVNISKFIKAAEALKRK